MKYKNITFVFLILVIVAAIAYLELQKFIDTPWGWRPTNRGFVHDNGFCNLVHERANQCVVLKRSSRHIEHRRTPGARRGGCSGGISASARDR